MNLPNTGSVCKPSRNAALIAAWRASRGLKPQGPLLISYESVVPLFEVERRRAGFQAAGVAGLVRDVVLYFPCVSPSSGD
jgi:hypothetical protein